MTNEARKDAAAVAGAKIRPYPHYLERIDQSIADIELVCWYDFEPADRSVGLPATAWLIHARPAGSPCDIADILDSRVIKRLEREAAEVLDQESADGGRYDFD
jgi:hypothetical protein